MNGDFLIHFDEFCKTCEHKDVEETKKPCDECLGTPCRFEDDTPLNYKEKEN